MKDDVENPKFKEACRRIAERIFECTSLNSVELNRLKLLLSKELGIRPPRSSELLRAVDYDVRLKPLLKTKRVRSISGVVPIAVMVRPHPCPHGRCIYCPGGPEKGTPASYTGQEPAGRRALECNYDPFAQVSSRLQQLKEIGHDVDKVEIIILGGNFTYLPLEYQRGFVKGCLDALNGVVSGSLEDAKRTASKAPIRNSGITAETRPDLFKPREANKLLEMGFTRIELGVQAVFDDVLELVGRGHGVGDVVESFRIAKDCGFEVTGHFMLGLPGSSPERDLEMFKTVFSDPRFKPDNVKIYPTLVLKDTKLYEMWLKGEYHPYREPEAIRLIAEIKKIVPRWVRIQRIQRDIPAHLIVDGVKRGDLRNLVLRELKYQGLKCTCIRCREVGHKLLKDGLNVDPQNVRLKVERYEASEGLELFLSYEDPLNDVLVGLLRLRIPSQGAFRPEIAGRTSAIVRVLHVYGEVVPMSKRKASSWQHKGFGSMLLREAERIAQEEYDVKKILVLSALGVKEYYAKQGYRKEGVYMAKQVGGNAQHG